MDRAEQQLALRRRGAAAVDVNAPMGADRLTRIARTLARALEGGGPDATAVDLGCGRGALAVAIAAAAPDASVVGVDLDPHALADARDRAAAAGVADRCRFELGDAADVTGPHRVVAIVGSAHALGGVGAAVDHLWDRTAAGGLALVGDGVWTRPPDDWNREAFGDLPSADALVETALQVGWDVEDVETSTPAEWDDFERTWTDGVAAVGTDAARSYADERRAQYQRYRGTLGFAWLLLRRPHRPGRA